MKIILAAIILISGTASAYKAEHISISDYEFRRYVRPQLKSIINEFQTLLFALNPELSNYKAPYGHFRKLIATNQKFRRDCSVANQSCASDLKTLERELLKTLDSLKGEGVLDSRIADTKLVYQHSREILYQNVLRALLKTQNMLFHHRLVGDFGLDAMAYTDQINTIYDQFFTFLFKSSDPRFKNEFNSFWVNFIRPVDAYAIHQDNRDYFKKSITELNMRWHMLHVKLTKRSYNPNKQVSTLLNIMQRRWNNILKVSLKPKG